MGKLGPCAHCHDLRHRRLRPKDLTINASATVESKSGSCTEDCGPLVVSCETEPLAAGNYKLVFGEVEGTLTVAPINPDEPTCFGDYE